MMGAGVSIFAKSRSFRGEQALIFGIMSSRQKVRLPPFVPLSRAHSIFEPTPEQQYPRCIL